MHHVKCWFFFFTISLHQRLESHLPALSHSSASAFTSQLVGRFVAQPVPRWLVKLLPKWTPKEVMGVLSLPFSRMYAHTRMHTQIRWIYSFLKLWVGWSGWQVISGQWAVGLPTLTPMDPAPSRGLD